MVPHKILLFVAKLQDILYRYFGWSSKLYRTLKMSLHKEGGGGLFCFEISKLHFNNPSSPFDKQFFRFFSESP